ncbi:hypothetical protein IQ07DRAFT_176723 [Pyrenochaeta sp. DS3sAY3a]|nr:hypothetical protein IQ07DRAFT_176723 [Pyrenochaeta sp. DS3sAY3a]
MHFSTLVLAAAVVDLSIAGYVLEDDYMNDFYGNFDFFTGPDPTEGFVEYVDEATARDTSLINSTSTSAVQWGVDFKNITPQGRPSIRIESKKKYNSGLIVLDVEHMPFGCGTWPAFWTIGPKWPENGEIDILEGVNEMTNNAFTLHTGPGCTIGQDTTEFSGSVGTDNCDIAAEGQGVNVGCSIKHPSKQSYGAGLNKIGGGVFATHWTGDAISMFFFPRDSIPADVLGDSPDPSSWGLPTAKFTGGCDIEKTFQEQTLIFDTTFCGQWAGSIWGDGSCASKAATCDDFVRDNPEAFAEAYWEINALKVYQDNGETNEPSVPSTPAESTPASLPLPAPTITGGFSTGKPPAVPSGIPTAAPAPAPSSNIVAPVPTSAIIPETPTETTQAPQPPAETTQPATIPSQPRPSPSRTRNTQIVAPTPGANSMPGFQWPLAEAQQPDDRPSTPRTTAPTLPAQNTTAAPLSTPTPAQNIAQPSGEPAVPDAPTTTPTCTGEPVPEDEPATAKSTLTQTQYRTVVVTVPAGAATPAPAGQRRARKVREMRQRLTRHNVRM